MDRGRRTVGGSLAVAKSLVVVESPTKVKTIQKYLDSKFIVKASMGHVRDLPKSQLGVDPKKNFKPKYVISPAKKKVLDELKKAAEKADALYVATDPDREGEAIGWHLAQELPFDKKNIFRITFNEITERAVKAAFTKPGKIDMHKVDAQQARRVLDRLVGYSLSPLLWDKVRRGLSAGRVQSVAVRLIVDREREIEAFVPVEYWSLHATLAGKRPPQFEATLREVRGEKASLVDEGAVGLITYMRTDSVRIAQEAQAEARGWASERLGAEYLPETPPVYKSRGSAQEAHEAIRPSDVARDPKSLARFLTKDQQALYRLIWERFLASQLMPAVYDTTTADIEAGECVFRAQGQTLKFKGFTAIYVESREESDVVDDETERPMPELTEGETLRLITLDPRQHFTQPPPRFTEASLINVLEELGIGRPSTYASILATIINERGYVHRERRTLFPTELGKEVTDLLLPFFRDIMDVEFTAQMEEHLDKVEEGERKWADTVQEFYEPFKRDLAQAKKKMRNVKVGEETGEPCPDCGEPLLERWGRMGKFLGCSGYPECRYTRNLNGVERAEDQPTDETCPTCSKPMVIKHGRFGKFIACSGYPECKTTKPVTLGIKCPETGCTGELVERRSKKGRTFFGCSAYPNCKFVVWQRPVNEPCPQCGAQFLTERVAKGRQVRTCARESCDFKQEAEI